LQFLQNFLRKIDENWGYFFSNLEFFLRKARLEFSKSGIEKIKSRFFLEKINEKIAKNKEKIKKIKDFFGKNRALKS
jgi:hypothetical protein